MSPSVGELVSRPGVSGSCAATARSAEAGNEDWQGQLRGKSCVRVIRPQVQKIRVVSAQMRTTTV